MIAPLWLSDNCILFDIILSMFVKHAYSPKHSHQLSFQTYVKCKKTTWGIPKIFVNLSISWKSPKEKKLNLENFPKSVFSAGFLFLKKIETSRHWTNFKVLIYEQRRSNYWCSVCICKFSPADAQRSVLFGGKAGCAF